MKKNNLFIQLLALIAIITLPVGCTNDDLLEEKLPAQNKLTIRASMPTQVDTRMSYTNTYDETGAEKLELKWEVGDEFYIYEDFMTKKATFKIENATDISDDGKNATFTYAGAGEIPEISGGTACFFKDPGYMQFAVPTKQSANDIKLFDNGGKLPMKAEGITISAGAISLPDITFDHMAFVLKYSFRLPAVTSRNIPVKVKLETGEPALAQNSISAGTVVEFALNNYDYIENNAANFDVYIPLIYSGSELGDNLTVTLKDAGGAAIGTFDAAVKNKMLNAGYMYTAKIAFDDAGVGSPVQTKEFSQAVAAMTLSELTSVTYGDGKDGLSESTAYEIGSAEALRKLILETKATRKIYAGKYFKLTTDIHVTADTWTPLDDYYEEFWGNFDGNGHCITGTLNVAGYNQGFFGFIYGNTNPITIKNLTVAANIVSSSYHIGGIVGYIQDPGDNVTIENCHFLGNLTAKNLAGGVLGRYQVSSAIGTVTIKGCTSRGNITSNGEGSDDTIGGIVGTFGNDGNVTECKNYAKVTGKSGLGRIGGIAGKFDKSTMSNCINYGQIDGMSDMGGIVGYSSVAGTYTNNENGGTIGNTAATKVGGIAGYMGGYATFTNNTNYSSKIYGNSNVGGVWGYWVGSASPSDNNTSPNFDPIKGN